MRRYKKHSLETVTAIALSYTNRTEFRLNELGSYRYAQANDLLEDITKHMKNAKIKYTPEIVKEEAKKYYGRTQFAKANIDMYQYARKHNFLDEVCKHMVKQSTIPKTPAHQRIKHSLESVKEEAKKYKTRGEFRTGSANHYTYSVKHNILDEVCKHMAPATHKHTRITITEEAKKYSSRYQFQIHSNGAYQYAQRYKLLDEVCKHMQI